MAAQPNPRITPEEYLRLDRAAEYKSEYYDGVMYSMAGRTVLHAHIGHNVHGALWSALGGRPCLVTTSDARVQVTERAYCYPDAAVICDAPNLIDAELDTIANPTVIFEVLSTSTEAHDRGYKFSLYSKIASLQEYVLVSQWEERIEVFRRQPEGKWLLTVFEGDAVCRLESIDCQIALSDVYRNVTLQAREVPARTA
jgi:Uma2 family endonuclease